MKTKANIIFSAGLAAVLIAMPRAYAVTGDAMTTPAPADATTNSKPSRRDGGAVR